MPQSPSDGWRIKRASVRFVRRRVQGSERFLWEAYTLFDLLVLSTVFFGNDDNNITIIIISHEAFYPPNRPEIRLFSFSHSAFKLF